ncbi:adenylate/guanylate cyclase domain-containing protein [Microvirga aerophila]|uniref:Guanylyl cyclase n=1 Tax=Microvirga aerophila TaxID=670291 RepID=A0A512C0J3_9HYPH|nr:adenylate/guanylate cyclase domain-containing protein [Microvirga aerophila]GEO17710.1 guanylyl cyclase [Microvirga aerophila]
MGSQHRVERKLAAILAADVEGYSRLMQADEDGTLETLTACREIMDRLIAGHGGRIANTAGDSVLAEFPSVVDAVRCAVAVQEALADAERGYPEGRRVRFRIGVHMGDVIVRAGDLFGDGVNIAARLQALASPGGVCISGEAHRCVRRILALAYTDLGHRTVRNIEDPIRIFAIGPTTGMSMLSDTTPLSLPDKPSIAVLPFATMGGCPDQDYLSDGICEEITTTLSRLHGFFVIARSSAFTYKGKPSNVQQVSRELGVRYVLEGSVRRAGDRVRIGVHLADAVAGTEVWAERYERALVDLFALQDEITASIVTAVEPQLYAAESARLQHKPPGSLDAWGCFIQALPHMWRLRREDNRAALNLLEDALRLDPIYARALGLHAWLSLWNAHTGWSAGGLQAVLAPAAEEALTTVSLARDDPWARLALGFAYMFQRAHEDAVEELHLALDLNPNFSLAHACLGLTLAYGGKGTAAVAHLDTATRISPRDPFFSVYAGVYAFAHFMAGSYGAGLDWARRSVRLSPDFPGHWRAVALSAAALEHWEEAKSAVAAARRLQPGYSVAWVEKASPLVHAWDRERYCAILRPVGLPEE